MKSLAQLGRYFFAIPFCVFGIQYFLYGHYAGGLSPVPLWAPGGVGAYLIAAGLSITSGIAGRLACFSLGLMFFLWTVVLHAPRVVTHLNNGGEWSGAFVALAMAGASFLLLASFSERT